MYICKNAKDRADFEKLLNTYGIYDETILVDRKGIFYPMLRKRMMESWERLFRCRRTDRRKWIRYYMGIKTGMD
ncbi:MAG: DUF3841 domain-containing protein [[Clostridium] symbiosum]